jgi:glutamate decarboxylase
MLATLPRAALNPASLFAATEGAANADMEGAISELIAEFSRGKDVSAPADPDALAARFAANEMPAGSLQPERYLAVLREDVLPYSNRVASPRCLAHMNQGPPGFLALLARLVAALNQNLTKADASRALTLCERQALAMMHRLVYGCAADFYARHAGHRDSTLGIVTSGGTLANLTALWCARNRALGPCGDFRGVERAGLPAALRFHGYREAVVIGPESMHYSFAKAAGLLGLGEQGLVRVPLDGRGRIDVPALRATVAACQARRACILALVGVAGSTDAGALDPLAELAEVARAAKVHFHVDAAWGGPFLFSPRHRGRLAGIARADSVTLDGHKQLYLPLGIGLLLLRDPHAARAIEKQAHYLSRPGSADLGRRSLEGSRPGTALFLHAGLHVFGRAGYAALVEESLRKASWLADRIKDRPDFELLAESDSNLVLYRYVPAAWRDRLLDGGLTAADHQALNRFNKRLHRVQRRAGRTYVSRTMLFHTRYGRGVPVVALRAVIANPLTTEADLTAVLQDQQALAQGLASAAWLRRPFPDS